MVNQVVNWVNDGIKKKSEEARGSIYLRIEINVRQMNY